MAEIWAKERGCRSEDLAPGILAAASLGGLCGGAREPIEAGVVEGNREKWRCVDPVRLRDWPLPRHVSFVLALGPVHGVRTGSAANVVFPLGLGGRSNSTFTQFESEQAEGDDFSIEDIEEGSSVGGGEDPSCSVHSPSLPGSPRMELHTSPLEVHTSPLEAIGDDLRSAALFRAPSAGLSHQTFPPRGPFSAASPIRPWAPAHASTSYIDKDASASGVNHERVSRERMHFSPPGGIPGRDSGIHGLGSGPKSGSTAAVGLFPGVPNAFNTSLTRDTRPRACSEGLEDISSSEMWKDAAWQLGLESV